MSREFNNGVTTDLMLYASNVPGGYGNGAHTTLLVIRIMATNDGVWISGLESDSSAGANPGPALGRRSSGTTYYSTPAGVSDAVSWTDSDNWCVIAGTKASGSATPNHYKIPIGGATSSSAGNLAGGNFNAADRLKLGGPSDGAHVRIAAAAIWNSVLTQGQIEGIASAKTTASILALSPLWCVDDSDGLATDLVGTADRTTLTGTSDNADDPAGWAYFGASGPSQRFRWRD